ncbi:MAG: hypothetical protein QM658_02140 [Gordonia sp. (in: high G+C Gram-positive bacteria)]
MEPAAGALRLSSMWRFDEHGLLRRQGVLASGVSIRELDAAIRAKTLVRVERGVYIDAETLKGEPRYRQKQIAYRARCLAVATRHDGDRVLSHESAAAVHGLPMLDPDRRYVHVINGKGSGGHSKKRLAVVHAGRIPPAEIVTIDGVRVTSLARAAADLARKVDFARGLAVLDAAMRLGVERAELEELLAARRAGVGAARYALRHADPRAANPGESWSRAQIIAAGFPVPELQVEHVLADGSSAFVDFDWEGKVVGEFDGVVKYGRDYLELGQAPADVVVAEKLREDALRDLGLGVVRWVYKSLRTNAMLDRVRTRLRARGIWVPD